MTNKILGGIIGPIALELALTATAKSVSMPLQTGDPGHLID